MILCTIDVSHNLSVSLSEASQSSSVDSDSLSDSDSSESSDSESSETEIKEMTAVSPGNVPETLSTNSEEAPPDVEALVEIPDHSDDSAPEMTSIGVTNREEIMTLTPKGKWRIEKLL